ncbi:MAG: ABC transporter substrate-binding protein [Alphaproteobacteria bacterium]|nr:ABC transporter substrate-binding protein [Alphaproteobacteria bacterium]
MIRLLQVLTILINITLFPVWLKADESYIPILVPVTGFLSLEGTAQRNGAIQALDKAPINLNIKYEVSDTATSPEVAVTALHRALSRGQPAAIAAPIFGTQMLAMLPIAKRASVALITVSGTAKLTELNNPFIFRFFPGDSVVKVAHARYIHEVLGAKRPALLYQTTAYGQSGYSHLSRILKENGTPLVFEEALAPSVKDMLPALTKLKASNPDVILLHLHSTPTALVIRQARNSGIELPIVAGSAMHQPSTARLLKADQLRGVCAETAASPISELNNEVIKFTTEYKKRFATAPDAFALAQYDGMNMVIAALKSGAKTAIEVRNWLATNTFKGLAMSYKSDGKGNMAHDATIVCYDGKTRIPKIIKRYLNVDGVF